MVALTILALVALSSVALGKSVVNMSVRPEHYKVSFSPYVESFSAFKHAHGRSYQNEDEEAYRYSLFIQNVHKMEAHNVKYHNGDATFYMNVNHFSDMTHDEYLMYNRLGKYAKFNKIAHNLAHCSKYEPKIASPASIDWRTKGAVTSVKNQGECGSCYTFSTTGAIEGQNFVNTGSLLSFSEQQIVDCCKGETCDGCDGGLMDSAFAYINSTGGLELESDYSYTAEAGSCQFTKSKAKVEVVGCSDIPENNEADLQNAVGNVGPVAVGIDASLDSFMSYAGGIYNDPGCSTTVLDHAVLAVGYGTLNNTDYWIVKNSWGPTWGKSGYFLLSRNNNQCGIAASASFPLTAKSNSGTHVHCILDE